jgi:hypothetical protein
VYRAPDIDHWCGHILYFAADLLAGGLMAYHGKPPKRKPARKKPKKK